MTPARENRAAAGRSSWDTKPSMHLTTADDKNSESATRQNSKKPLNMAAIYERAPSVTMSDDSSAPLAQLAEQLTLNQ
jgi:hypothetical protein